MERWKRGIEDGTSCRRADGVGSENLNEAVGEVEQDEMEKKGDKSVKGESEGRTGFWRGAREK